MSEQAIDFVIDMSAAATYEPFSGLSKDHFTHDGAFLFKIVEVTPGKGEKNSKIDVKFEVVDADNKGRRTFKSIPVSGLDKNGKPNVLQFIGLVAAARAMTVEQVRSLAQYGAQHTAAQLLPALLPIGIEVAADVETDFYKGKAQSDIKWFIERPDYEAKVKSGSHRVPHKAQQAVATPPAAFTMPTTGAPNVGSFPAMAPIAGLPTAAPSIVPTLPVAAAPVAAPVAAPAMNGAMPGIPGLPPLPGFAARA